MKRYAAICPGCLLLSLFLGVMPAAGDPGDAKDPVATDVTAPAPEMHSLKYKFTPGETVRWNVEHRSHIKTTISGITQSAESLSVSVKAWKITDVDGAGNATFEHSVESIRMRQKLSGRKEIAYDSLVDKDAPPTFEAAAKSVGVTLTVVKMDAAGKVIERTDRQARPGGEDAPLTISLPSEVLPVGGEWSVPREIEVVLKDRPPQKIQTRQKYTLKEVKNGIAIIHAETQILSPVRHDPAIEAQLVQRETTGDIRFDIEAGRIVGQEIELDKHVIGFAGEQSSLHCRTQFLENLLEDVPATAGKNSSANQ